MKTKRFCSYIICFFVALLSCHQICNAKFITNTNSDSKDQTDAKISPKCAAVLLAAAGTAGVTAAAFTPTALCTAGFCSTGVAGGSFASWWQSTMPLVAKGSLFSYLQSIAMGGAGSMVVLQNIVGAVIGVKGISYLGDFCAYVDDVDPESAAGRSVELAVYTVTTSLEITEKAKELCADSSTCMAGKEMITSAASMVIETAGEVKKKADEFCTDSETCALGREKAMAIVSSAADISSLLWNSLKERVSGAKTSLKE